MNFVDAGALYVLMEHALVVKVSVSTAEPLDANTMKTAWKILADRIASVRSKKPLRMMEGDGDR